MIATKCPCCSLITFSLCCEPIIFGNTKAATALALMRSRYTAYGLHQANYLLDTTYRSERKNYSKTEILNWAKSSTWLQLEIIDFSDNTVEFKAHFLDVHKQKQVHHELSTFIFEDGNWCYFSGVFFS